MIQILDGGQMGEGIASRELNRTRDTVQPLLKLFRGVGLGRAPYHSGGSYHSFPPSSTSKLGSVWSVWLIWFVWLNETNQMNKTNQRNQINLSCQSRVLARLSCGSLLALLIS